MAQDESANPILSQLFFWRGVITLALSVPLIVFSCYWYGVKRVVNLREKSFHLTLCALMILCGVFYAVSAALGLVSAEQELSNENVLKATVLINSIAWLLNLLLHTQFIIKYWLICQRVEAVIK